jgi:hypothetical protein
MKAEHRGECEVYFDELCADKLTRVTSYSLGGALNVDVFYKGACSYTMLFDEDDSDEAVAWVKTLMKCIEKNKHEHARGVH